MSYLDYMKDLSYVDAIMIIDRYGKIVYSVRYNPRFDNSKSNGIGDIEEIINKNFLEIYPSLDSESSTMMTCLEDGIPIYLPEQTFSDYKGRVITTQNLTIPIIKRGKIVGAIELSKDITKVQSQKNNEKIKNKNVMRKNRKNEFIFNDIVTKNKEMIENIERAKMISNNDSSVLIYGETGTGKELYVQSIHNYSNRRKNRFIAQNCAALPENLFESILFGTKKGAFTGAIEKEGLFEMAEGGTLFLDEINSMPLNLQAKLLRVLQDGKVRRIGGDKEKKTDVRIIAAMNKDPMDAIESGELRKDLFYRLSVVSLRLLPLRERREDIQLYVDYFTDYYGNKYNKRIEGIDTDVEDLFLTYDWPGNVRELEHVIESSINFVENNKIKMKHLPIYMSRKKDIKVRSNDFKNPGTSLQEQLNSLEEEIIRNALSNTSGNITKAAKLLEISRQNLHHKIIKYNL